jgi:hypothetical protein
MSGNSSDDAGDDARLAEQMSTIMSKEYITPPPVLSSFDVSAYCA